MESISAPACLFIEERAFAFSPEGLVVFTVSPNDRALVMGNVFIVDIYAADDHSHPDGHAGWWECSLTGKTAITVQIVCGDGRIEVFFDGVKAESSWINDAFNAADRRLLMHLVVREGRSNALIFNDPVKLYPGQPIPVDEAPLVSAVPPEVPPRWFLWPPQTRVLVAFDTVLSAGSRNLYGQITGLLRQNGIPFEVYALSYTADQRRGLKPAGYLLRDARRDDLVFCVSYGDNTLLSLAALLPCKKMLYRTHLSDYREFQAFDARFARKLAGAEEQLELLLSFDGICYESEYTRKYVTGRLRSKIREAAAKSAAKPVLPPCLGVFPPVLWPRTWEDVEEERCHVPELFMLSVGSFRPDKHHELTLKVFAEAAKKNPALVLVIAGWPSIDGYYDYVRYLREDTYAAAASRIIFLQNCTDGQLLYLYRRAAVFFSACSHEGSSGSIMDALVFNLPVIARRTSSIQEILGCSGIYFDAAALPEQIAAAVLSIVENPEERAKALEIQKKYAPASSFNQNPHPVQKLLKVLYETAVGGPSR